MKTFGEVNIGDELYSIYTGPCIEIKKEKIIHIEPGYGDCLVFTVGTKHSFSEFCVEPTDTIGFWAPTLEGVIEYWKQEYTYKIEKQEKKIETLKVDLVKMYDKLNKILKVKE